MTADRILCGEEIALWRIEKSRQRKADGDTNEKILYLRLHDLPELCLGQGHVLCHDMGDLHEVIVHLSDLRILAEQMHQLLDPDNAPVVERVL